MAGVPFIDDSEEDIWDKLSLGHHGILPGVWSVDGDADLEIDVKKGKSKDGARVRAKGYNPSELNLVGRMVEKEDWDKWVRIASDLHPRRKGKARGAHSIQHPVTVYFGIRQVLVIGVGAPRVVDGGIHEVSLKVIEYEKPKKMAPPKPAIKVPDFIFWDPAEGRNVPPSEAGDGYVGG